MAGSKKVSFKNSNGLNLVGILHNPENKTDSAVIIAHGFTSNKDYPRHIKTADALASKGIAAFRMDFGGSGESDGREITIASELDDLESAIKYMKNLGYENMGLLGESLGGLISLKAYSDDIKAIILWAPVTRIRQTLQLTDLEKKSLEDKGYFIRVKDGKDFKIPQEYINERLNVDKESVLREVKIPVLIIHGTEDKTIPISDSEDAIGFLPHGSSLDVIKGWGHGEVEMEKQMDVIIPKTVDWFKDHLL
jgi:alpha-beta hydrolase superfamily lysophospholipase